MSVSGEQKPGAVLDLKASIGLAGAGGVDPDKEGGLVWERRSLRKEGGGAPDSGPEEQGGPYSVES